MVEVILNSVLDKLANEATNKFMQTGGVGQQIEKLRRELSRIQAFLKDADRKTIRDEMQKHWVKEVGELAYDIEDIIDNALLLELEVPHETTSNEWTFQWMFKKPRKLWALHEFGDQINQILERIEEISNIRSKYGIKDVGEWSVEDFTLPLKPPLLPDIDDPNIVGFDTHKANILKVLLDENIKRRSVVAIVGVGGLGKTTLARKTYNSADVKTYFNLRIWVTVSRKFELIDVLKRMLEQIRPIDSSEQGKDNIHFLTQLHKSLGGKKYLLVLDDVWTEELWSHIEEALVDVNNGSRVLITSRNENVARVADSSLEQYKPSFLCEEQGLQLLLKKAGYNPDRTNDAYSSDLIDIAQELVKKCGGLPLALVVLGSLLSKKPPKYTSWNKLLRTMSWHTDGSRCTEILATSYDDLPLALKSCFMYFAAFPEDYQIEAKELIRLWIAECFILQEENRTLEHTAEIFLEDLVQRSMIEISRGHGGTEYCHIHDLMRDLAIEKAKEANYLTICSTHDKDQSCSRARRLAAHHSDCDVLVKYASSNLRTLLVFNSWLPNCYGYKLLKVLRVVSVWPNFISITGAEKIEVLTQLRYLQLNRITCPVDIDKETQLCKSINGMKFLQTLDISCVSECDLSDFTWEIETLRHVNLPRSLGPPPGANLRNLKTLAGIRNREQWDITALAIMPNLCSLGIEITKGFSWKVVVAFLHTLKSLVNLTLFGDNFPTEVIDMRDFPFYQQLNSLKCKGNLYLNTGEVLDAAMFPIHLTVLQLRFHVIGQDLMVVLEKLSYLEELELLFADIVEDIKKMRCSAGGFPHLQILYLTGPKNNLKKWEIEEGAMPMLKELAVRNFPMLQVPLGLKHLTKLNKLEWKFMREDQSATTQAEEICNLCGHVPQLEVRIG